MGDTDVEERSREIDPRSQAAYASLWQGAGRPPQHNQFVEAAVQAGVSRTKARKDYQMLRGQPARPPDQEARVPTVPPSVSTDERAVAAQDLQAEVQTLRAQVATLTRRDQALEHAVQELRALVQVLSPRPSHSPVTEVGEVPARLGRLEARVASQERRLGAVETQAQVDRGRLTTLSEATRPLQQFWQLLCTNEDAWGAWRAIVRSGSNWTHKTLLKFFVEGTGHQLEHNEKVHP